MEQYGHCNDPLEQRTYIGLILWNSVDFRADSAKNFGDGADPVEQCGYWSDMRNSATDM